MGIAGINNYNDVLFQWQSQQLKTSGTESKKTAQSDLLNSLFGGSTSMTQQISSMVELTKYAMNAMGLSSDSRVTFSQITKYREQLQNEFNTSVKNAFAQSGISDIASMTFSLDKDGMISVSGGSESDRKMAQKWLGANPSFGLELRDALKAQNIENEDTIDFRLSSSGKMSIVNKYTDSVQSFLNENSELSDALRESLKETFGDLPASLSFKLDSDGNLHLENELENTAAINDWLAENRDFADALKNELDKKGVDLTSVSLKLGESGVAQITVNRADLNEAQAVLDSKTDIGKKIFSGLNDLGIDPDISFSIQVNEDGSVKIIGDHKDIEKVQQFFDENPDLVKKYRQIETLAGIDDARKAMQISPSAMRKRIQIESMAAWWVDSGNSNSYFGNYQNSNLSLMYGLNMNV